LDIPNSTVCISLLEQIFVLQKIFFDELLLFTMLRIESLISEVGTFLFIRFQLESPLIMCLFFGKVKRFLENNLQKILKSHQTAENRHFFLSKKF
jgi:hypothetical protein